MTGLEFLGANNPNLLIQVTYEQLEDLVSRIMDRKLQPTEAPEIPTQEEYTGEQVSIILCEKGYHAKSHKGRSRILEDHEIEGERKGKQIWYKKADIDRIPRCK